jgi:cytochrome c553
MRRRRGLAWCTAALACAAVVCTAAAQTTPKKPGAQSARARAAAASAAAASAAAAATAADYAQRFATVCVACHGPGGRSEQTGVPVLAGQHSFYVITQLFLFREGRRDNPAMTAVAKTMTDADLRGFSDYIGTLPPAPAASQPTAADPQHMANGRALAQLHKCVFCHGADFAGGQQVPRIAGQREEYLRDTLHGFRTGKRPGYTQAMIGALAIVPPEDLDTLAYYAAHFPAAAASAPAAAAGK